jgi:hypothetical protein
MGFVARLLGCFRVASETAIARTVTIAADHTFENADFAISESNP